MERYPQESVMKAGYKTFTFLAFYFKKGEKTKALSDMTHFFSSFISELRSSVENVTVIKVSNNTFFIIAQNWSAFQTYTVPPPSLIQPLTSLWSTVTFISTYNLEISFKLLYTFACQHYRDHALGRLQGFLMLKFGCFHQWPSSVRADCRASDTLLLFSCQVQLDSLWPHELQQAKLPCPSLSPWVCSNSCPLSQWCHPTISSSVTPFSSCPQSFPVSGSFIVDQLFASGGQSIGASALALVLPHTLTHTLKTRRILIQIVRMIFLGYRIQSAFYSVLYEFLYSLIKDKTFSFWKKKSMYYITKPKNSFS